MSETSFQSVWANIVQYIESGISVIPVREKDDVVNGKPVQRKGPFGSWAKYQSEIVSKEELWYFLEKYKTSSIGTICGRVSGNLEAIDIDSKWHPTIATLLFEEIKSLKPDLFDQLRIHRSPSGGFHILYRVDVWPGSTFVLPGNKKLASRLSTAEELLVVPEKQKCFLETRGEGGYVVAPPSLGYTVYQDRPIPKISELDREELINICISFNQIVKTEPERTDRSSNDLYDENPFEHFNKSAAGEDVLAKNGWEFHSKNARGLYFSRPGSVSKGLHAVYFFDRKLFYFFTTNTVFDAQRAYQPSTVRALLEFDGDKKKLLPVLVKEKFGVLKPHREAAIVKNAAFSSRSLPGNLSDKAIAEYQKKVDKLVKTNPHGIFWETNEKNKIVINQERLLMVAEELGFRLQLVSDQICQIDGNLIYKRTVREFQDQLKNYIQEDDGDLHIEILNAYEAWSQSHHEYILTRIKILDEENIFKDTMYSCYKFFLNGFLLITKDEVVFSNYNQVTGYIWEEDVQKRNYVAGKPGGKYVEFLKLAVRYHEKTDYVESIIGYLSHQWKNTATGFIIVLVEESPDPKNGGGTGKNVLTNLFKLTTSVKSISGAQISFDSKFLQAWNFERILALSDVPKKFDFLFLKEPSTGEGVLKKLFKDEVTISCEMMPKFIIQTNYSYDVSDGGLKRRIIPLEFTNFFTLAGGLNKHFGCMFPDGWEEIDWIGFDNFIAKSVQTWLLKERFIEPINLSDGGAKKQFEQVYGLQTREFFEQHWEEWVAMIDIPNTVFNEQYEKFCNDNMVQKQFHVSGTKMNHALAEWCKEKNFEFKKDFIKRNSIDSVNPGLVYKCRRFVSIDPPF